MANIKNAKAVAPATTPTVTKTADMAEGAPAEKAEKKVKKLTALEKFQLTAERASKFAARAANYAKRARLDKSPVEGLSADALVAGAAAFAEQVSKLSALVYFVASPGALKTFTEGGEYQLSLFAKPPEKARKQYAPGDIVVLVGHTESDDGNITLHLDHKGLTDASGTVIRPALGTINVTGWSKIEGIGTDHSKKGTRPRKAKVAAAADAAPAAQA